MMYYSAVVYFENCLRELLFGNKREERSMNILVTGGAGYIGSHAVKKLLDKEHRVIVIDNLTTGFIQAVDPRAVFYHVDIRDKGKLNAIFKKHNIDLVMHFAAKIIAPESLNKPLEYYDNNVFGSLVLLKVMQENHVNKIVFSSTAAVYGLLDKGDDVIYETDPTSPINPYGYTKLVVENMIKDANRAYGLQYIIFRYFNVAGGRRLGNPLKETALIPRLLLTANGFYDKFYIFGNDYNTKDGTCIRDYVHVEDLVDAHILAAEKIFENKHENGIYNLGNGKGFTVLEIYKKALSVTGRAIPMEFRSRREGDPVISVASSKKAKHILGWKPVYKSIEQIILSAWVETYEKQRILRRAKETHSVFAQA